ncbi:MAG TPA: uracil-DNA glycosylase [Solirubrobacteraceae bacterium]|nr:uracil-DNA glycosylase [Solirubrobacteraceae bacterium]
MTSLLEWPRVNRDPDEVARKRALLGEPHIAPLTRFVERLRASRGGGEAVPWFDPTEAGVGARILLLLEAPGPKATGGHGPRPASRGSGFVSPDNDDHTAQNMWTLLQEAHIDRRREIVTWNVVPWYVGDGDRIRAVSARDLLESRSALGELLGLLEDLRVVVLLGRKAAQGWRSAAPALGLATIEAPHPSPLVLNTTPGARAQILNALLTARCVAGLA